MTEAELVRQVRDLLSVLGAWSVKMHGNWGLQRKGIPDIIAIYRGRTLAIECKSAKGRVSKEQDAELRAIEEAGGIAIIARSLEDVLRGLRPLDSGIGQRIRL